MDALNDDLYATLKAISDASAAAYQEGKRDGKRDERERLLGIIKSEIGKLPDDGSLNGEHLIAALHGIVDRVKL